MKTLSSVLLSVFLLSPTISSRAAGPGRSEISIQGTMITLSKAQASQFIAGHHLDTEAARAFNDLQSLVEQKKAEVVANPGVTAKNGQRALNESESTRLEVEPVLSPSGDLIDVTLQLNYGKSVKIATAYRVMNGEIKFLGFFDAAGAGEDMTYLVFVPTSALKDQ